MAQEGSKYGADTRPSRTPGTRANGPAVLCMAGAKEGELRRATGQGRGRCDAARSNRRRGERRCQKATIKRPLRVIKCAMPAGEVSHRPPGRLEGPCSPRHEALLAGAWKDLASLHRAALIRDHRRPRTASAWRPRALARRAALRWFGSFDSLCRRTPGGRGSQKWLRGPLPFGRGTASGTSSVATAARRAAARRCWRWWFEVGLVQSSVDESRASAVGCHVCAESGKYISLIGVGHNKT